MKRRYPNSWDKDQCDRLKSKCVIEILKDNALRLGIEADRV
ncbi:hypothetical protein [Paramaledivibacter caminithermalis]|jgi:hypothetical protein|nr:hypothetical protein [Paramaledivibacter caminithermalis]